MRETGVAQLKRWGMKTRERVRTTRRICTHLRHAVQTSARAAFEPRLYDVSQNIPLGQRRAEHEEQSNHGQDSSSHFVSDYFETICDMRLETSDTSRRSQRRKSKPVVAPSLGLSSIRQ